MYEQNQLLLCLNKADYKYLTIDLYHKIQELGQFKVTMTFYWNLPGISSLLFWIALHWNIYYTCSISVKLPIQSMPSDKTFNAYFPQIQYDFYLTSV